MDYESGGQWPQPPGGEGSSLELIHPDMDNSQPSAWRASDESQKSTLQTLHPHRHLPRTARQPERRHHQFRELHLHCVSDAHLLLRDISLTRAGSGQPASPPATPPPTTAPAPPDSSAPAPTARATPCRGRRHHHRRPGFHLISTGTGDTKNNKAEVDVTDIAKDDILTLTFQARWISGMPLLVAQTWDRSFGKVFRLPIPNNLGTPGAANSTRRAAAPARPSINSPIFPAVPTSSQPVRRHRRASPSAVTGQLRPFELVRRLDNSSMPMAPGRPLADE